MGWIGAQDFVYKQLEQVSVCVQEWQSDKLFEKKLLPGVKNSVEFEYQHYYSMIS